MIIYFSRFLDQIKETVFDQRHIFSDERIKFYFYRGSNRIFPIFPIIQFRNFKIILRGNRGFFDSKLEQNFTKFRINKISFSMFQHSDDDHEPRNRIRNGEGCCLEFVEFLNRFRFGRLAGEFQVQSPTVTDWRPKSDHLVKAIQTLLFCQTQDASKSATKQCCIKAIPHQPF